VPRMVSLSLSLSRKVATIRLQLSNHTTYLMSSIPYSTNDSFRDYQAPEFSTRSPKADIATVVIRRNFEDQAQLLPYDTYTLVYNCQDIFYSTKVPRKASPSKT
jgi:hypothetical protein